ncbi:MAG: Cas10/Cmr2 second palm domain-containing protein [Methylococcales bacterium]
MPTFILVEAVNIYQSVSDTDQLSVIRGSGLLLKEAIDHIKIQFADRLEALSTGASSGLFLLKDKPSEITKVINSIKCELGKNPYANFVFLVEYCQAEDLLTAKEKLYTQLRFHQMRSITAVPDRVSNDRRFLNYPCELEGRRIAASDTKRTVQGRTRQLAQSVFERLEFGRERRQDLYFQEGDKEELSVLKDYRFSDDLESLAKTFDYPKLNNKIAVVYMDGNKFTEIQRQTLERAKQPGEMNQAQIQFDKTIQKERSNFLRDTLLAMVDPASSRFPDAVYENDKKEKVIRFETLLWGGDEMLFVLPDWFGFEFLQYFFQKSSQWAPVGDERLTHSAGLVFCHAKSPIHRIRELAKSLADTMKNELGDNRKQNVWDYIVLESIDYPGNKDIAEFNGMRFGHLAAHRPKTIRAPRDWNSLKPMLNELIGESLLSRRQLYKIAETIQAQPKRIGANCLYWQQLSKPDAIDRTKCTEQERAEHRMLMLLKKEQRESLTEKAPVLAKELFNLELDGLHSRACFWFHLIELWDYLLPQKNRPQS